MTSRQELPHSDLAFSGGGLRALASAATFFQALENTRSDHPEIMKSIKRHIGVSGGGWFLLAQKYGVLKNVISPTNDRTVNHLLQTLVATKLATALHPTERGQLEDTLAPLLNSVFDMSAKATSSIASSLFGVEVPKVVVDASTQASTKLASDAVMNKLIRQFGMGVRSALSQAPTPFDSWELYLGALLFNKIGEEQVKNAKFSVHAASDSDDDEADNSNDVPETIIAAICDELDAPAVTAATSQNENDDDGLPQSAFDWLGFSCSSRKVPCVRPAVDSRSASSFNSKLNSTSMKGQAPQQISPKKVAPVRQVACFDYPSSKAFNVCKLAAVCGSAFAFDFAHGLNKALGSNYWIPASVIPKSTVELNLTVNGTTFDRKLLRLRDAGIDVNVAFLLTNSEVVWVLDSSANGSLGGQLKKATKNLHLPSYKDLFLEAKQQKTNDVPTGVAAGRWTIFVPAHQPSTASAAILDDPNFLFPKIPKVIIYFMGLTDDQTMQPENETEAGRRLKELEKLHRHWLNDIPEAAEAAKKAL